MAYAGDRRGLAASTVRKVVRLVIAGERRPAVTGTVTFLSPGKMRALNRRTFDLDRSTDVIAFGLPHAGTLVADIYVCPAAARRAARALGIPVRQELVRLVTHGVLHVLGYDHEEGDARMTSEMWRRQERYVRAALEPSR